MPGADDGGAPATEPDPGYVPGRDLVAEALERRMAQVAREERMAAVAAAEEADSSPAALDALDVIEALCDRHQETTAAVLAWSWKLFCARWARLYAWTAQERERREARAVEREFARLRRS